MNRRPLPALVLASSALLALTACSGSTTSTGAQSPAASTPTRSTASGTPDGTTGGTTTATPTETSSTATPAPALTWDVPAETGESCVQTSGRRDLAWFESPIHVVADLTVDSVRLEDSPGMTLVEDDSFNLPPVNPGGRITFSGSTSWPLTREDAGTFVQWDARDDLVGRTYAAGDTGLPVLHLSGAPGARLGSVVLGYTTDDGVAGEARYSSVLRFEKHC